MTSQPNPVIKDGDTIDLNKASISLSLSSTDFDEETGEFHVSIDRAVFHQPLAIISKVLEAHSYETNLENILACLDHLYIGVHAKTSGRVKNGLTTAKSYLPSLVFKLPQKTGLGFALKKFYEEVQAYEHAIQSLSTGETQPAKPTSRPGDLKEKIQTLEDDKAQLEAEVAHLQGLLDKALRSEANANQALASQNLLPANLRLAIVKDLDLENRCIVLKSGRTNVNVPISLAEILPVTGDKCLLQMENGSLRGCYFYQTGGVKLKPILATIIHSKDQCYKLRTEDRRSYLLEVQNEAEERALYGKKVGDCALIYLVNDKIIAITALEKHATDYRTRVGLSLAAAELELIEKEA